VKIYKARLFAVLTALFMIILIAGTNIILHRQFLEKGPELDNVDIYVLTHTNPSDTIWGWTHDTYLYYKTRRKMGTLVYDPHQNLDYGLAWEKSNYREIDFVWNRFMSDLETNRPKLIIDSTGKFASVDDYVYKGPLLENIQNFYNYMNTHYRVATVIDGTKIWERIN